MNIEVNDLVDVRGHRYRVVGVHLGEANQENIITLAPVSHWAGDVDRVAVPVMAVPQALLEGLQKIWSDGT